MGDKNCKNLVSVLIITYNHEDYIRQTIDGALMQECDFNYNIVIAEDYSQDKTRNICKEYEKIYPDKIKIIPREKNVGLIQNYSELLDRANSKYIAQCSGDDFWTDRKKLQKQVEFLESNPNYSLCYHNYNQIFTGKNVEQAILNTFKKGDYTIKNIWYDWMIQASTIMFKTEVVKDSYYLKHATNKNMYYEDLFILLCAKEKGSFFGLNDIMSTYRKHPGSITAYGSSPKTEQMDKMLNYITYIGKLFNEKYKKQSQDYYTFKAFRYAYVCKERKLYLKSIVFLLKSFFSSPSKFINLFKKEFNSKLK